MNIIRNKLTGCCIIFFAIVFFITGTVSGINAQEPGILQNFQRGDKLPPISLRTFNDPSNPSFTPGNGKPSVIMFFSIRPKFRKKRSLVLLSALSDIANRYKTKLDVIGIYSDNQKASTVQTYIENSGVDVRVYNDGQKTAYNSYGVFMMPLIILADSEGKLHEVIPYNFNIRDLMENNIKFLLGEIDKDELATSLQPKQNIVKSKEEKEYIRRVNYGKIMLSKKMYGQAVREFSTAAKLMPDSIDAHIGLGYALLKTDKYDRAEVSFKKALEITPESDDAIAGMGLVHYARDEIEQALVELEKAFIAPEPRLEVVITLAEIYEKKGQDDKANRFNKLAVTMLMALFEQRWK